MRIPHGLRTMYVHAYQSYLWNAAVSERCLKHGTQKVVQGDLVLPAEPGTEEEAQNPGKQSVGLAICPYRLYHTSGQVLNGRLKFRF